MDMAPAVMGFLRDSFMGAS
jgi:hypothetical protein